MNRVGTHRHVRGIGIKSLLGTVSAISLAVAAPALAQTMAQTSAATTIPGEAENVLVTGSLIHGTGAVGVPVQSLGVGDFDVTGAVTVADLLKDQPAIFVSPSTSSASTAGNSERQARVDIHNFGSGHTLGLYDGMRFPLQSHTGTIVDPSFIPELAIDHIDVLAGGASATYGSDAEAGVINVILKRGFDGAITQFRVGTAEGGGFNWSGSQLYGKTWDSGDITLTFQHFETSAIPGSARTGQLTMNYTPWGLDDRTPIKSSIPGVISTGAANVATGTACTNCYSIPLGTGTNFVEGAAPMPTTSWTNLLAHQGVANEVNPYAIAQATPPQQNNSAAATFDQNLLPGVQLFGEAFYANRRGQQIIPGTINPATSGTTVTISVPTTNPYYPTGAPSGLRVNYSFGIELPPDSSYFEVSERYALGFNLDLPFDWKGKIFGSINDEENVTIVTNLVNANAALAAAGGTVAATPAVGTTPGIAAYTKPASIPYLNLFCDPYAFTCNAPETLAYITGPVPRRQSDYYTLREFGVNFDGPLFDLPGGKVRAAVGANYVHYDYSVLTRDAFSAASVALPPTQAETDVRQTYAIFSQVNIPVFGGNFTLPGFEKLEIELSGRYDHYSDFGNALNPKAAINWTVFDGLTLRGAMGTSFVAPSFSQLSAVTSRTIQPLNIAAGNASNNFASCPAINGTPVSGSAGAIINPTCDTSLQFAGGILIKGGVGGLAGVIRPSGYALGPETSHDTSFGFEYAPENAWLRGLDISVNYWKTHIANLNVALDDTVGKLTDPNTAFIFYTPATPGFSNMVTALLNNVSATGFSPGAASNIKFILDGAARNAGYIIHDGIDFNANYDWDMGRFGAWNVGVSGTYYLHFATSLAPGAAPVDQEAAPGGFKVVNGVVTADGPEAQDVRFKYRAHLGWSMDNWTATLFMNYRSHFFTTETLPGSSVLAASNILNYSDVVPALYTFDLALGYDTKDGPANPYLQNLQVQFVVNDIMDKMPPFVYKVSTSGNGAEAYSGVIDSPIGRTFSLTLTKRW